MRVIVGALTAFCLAVAAFAFSTMVALLSLVFESRLTFSLLHAEADAVRARYLDH